MRRLTTLSLVSLIACATPARDPAFDGPLGRARTLVIMPPDVSVELDTFSGERPRLPDQERRRGRRLAYTVAAELLDRDFEVRVFDPHEQALDDSPALRFEMGQIRASLREELGRAFDGGVLLKGQPRQPLAPAALGSQIEPFADMVGADALVFTQWRESLKSEGEMGLDAAIWVATLVVAGVPLGNTAVGEAELKLAIVDGRTGRVLWARQILLDRQRRAADMVEATTTQALDALRR